MSFGIIVRGKSHKTPHKWTNERMDKAFGHLEDHQYKHINRSLGMRVESKEHFRNLLEQGNYIPYEENVQQTEANKKKSKEYRLINSITKLNIVTRRDSKRLN